MPRSKLRRDRRIPASGAPRAAVFAPGRLDRATPPRRGPGFPRRANRTSSREERPVPAEENVAVEEQRHRRRSEEGSERDRAPPIAAPACDQQQSEQGARERREKDRAEDAARAE